MNLLFAALCLCGAVLFLFRAGSFARRFLVLVEVRALLALEDRFKGWSPFDMPLGFGVTKQRLRLRLMDVCDGLCAETSIPVSSVCRVPAGAAVREGQGEAA